MGSHEPGDTPHHGDRYPPLRLLRLGVQATDISLVRHDMGVRGKKDTHLEWMVSVFKL